MPENTTLLVGLDLEASRNHGKSANLANNSRPARSSQKPSRVILLTSTKVVGQLDLGFKPELRFASHFLNVAMKSRHLR